MDLLHIAFYLSILTYYIGALIKMLPIPLYGVKKWGPQLMIDGVFSAILIFSYNTIRWLITYIGGVLGASWSNFYSWLFSEVSIITSLIIVLKTIGIGLSSIGLSFISNSLISPLISSLTYLLLFLLTSSILITVLVSMADKILAIGLVLHAIPFKLTRSSGSTLIAMVIVFSIGAPLMPQFIELFPATPQIPSSIAHGYCLANIYVYDYRNYSIPHYLYEIYSISDNKLLARYVADANGLVNASHVERGIPSSKHVVYVKLAGYYYRTTVDPGEYFNNTLATVSIVLRTSNLIVLRPIRYAALFNYYTLNILTVTDSTVYLRVVSDRSAYFVVVGYSNDNISVYVNNTYRQPVSSISYEWGGCRFKAQNYTLPGGVHYVYIIVSGWSSCKPVFEEIYYARDTLGINVQDITTITYPVSVLIYRLFIAPVVYLSILFTASISLSRLLGGSTPRIARVLVSGL